MSPRHITRTCCAMLYFDSKVMYSSCYLIILTPTWNFTSHFSCLSISHSPCPSRDTTLLLSFPSGRVYFPPPSISHLSLSLVEMWTQPLSLHSSIPPAFRSHLSVSTDLCVAAFLILTGKNHMPTLVGLTASPSPWIRHSGMLVLNDKC